MNRAFPEKDKRDRRNYEWVWEVLILATVTPAIAYGVLSLHNLSIV